MKRQKYVGAFEAKTHFSQLIERAHQGEEIFITRRGKPIAKLVSVNSESDHVAAQAAAKRLRSLAKDMNLGSFHWEDWKKYRDLGRP